MCVLSVYYICMSYMLISHIHTIPQKYSVQTLCAWAYMCAHSIYIQTHMYSVCVVYVYRLHTYTNSQYIYSVYVCML